MNTNNSEDSANDETASPQLERLLHQWGTRLTPTPETSTSLQRAILEQATWDKSAATVQVHQVPQKSRVSVWWSSIMLVSILASTAILAWWWQGAIDKRTNSLVVQYESKAFSTETNPPLLANFSVKHVEQLTQEMVTLFGNRWAWLAETSNKISLGINSDAQESLDSTYIAVRVTLLHRSLSNQWQAKTLWSEDVVTRPESWVQPQTVEMAPKVSLWTHILPDGAVSIDTQIDLPGVEAGRLEGMSVQHGGQLVRLLNVQRGADVYEVWQMAHVISEPSL